MEEKTLKLRAYSDDIKNPAASINPADEKSLELAMKDAQIEEERSRSLEHLKTIVQLRESLKQEQAKVAEAAGKVVALEAKTGDLVIREARIRELTDALGKIAAIAAAGKTV